MRDGSETEVRCLPTNWLRIEVKTTFRFTWIRAIIYFIVSVSLPLWSSVWAPISYDTYVSYDNAPSCESTIRMGSKSLRIGWAANPWEDGQSLERHALNPNLIARHSQFFLIIRWKLLLNLLKCTYFTRFGQYPGKFRQIQLFSWTCCPSLGP